MMEQHKGLRLSPLTLPAGASLEKPLPVKNLPAILQPYPGTTDLDGTEKPKTHLERIKEILLSLWLRAASVHRKR